MNTLEYLQYFEGLAETLEGSFTFSRLSSKLSPIDLQGNTLTHQCDFEYTSGTYSGAGVSRKDALKTLYRKIQKKSKKIKN